LERQEFFWGGIYSSDKVEGFQFSFEYEYSQIHPVTRAFILCESSGEKMPYKTTVSFVMQRAEEDSVVPLINCTT